MQIVNFISEHLNFEKEMAITNDTNTSSGHSTESTDIVEVFTEKPDQPSIPQVSDDHISFILVPLGIIAILILLTAVVSDVHCFDSCRMN